jgi:hypothetical protein
MEHHKQVVESVFVEELANRDDVMVWPDGDYIAGYDVGDAHGMLRA